jgi:DNA modification methylase
MVKELTVEQIPIEELHNASWNANRVPEDVLAKVRRSITDFGVVENLVARERPEGGYEVISGNHRLGIYREMGITKAPVHVVDVDDAHARILAQTLNRTRGQDDAEAYAQLLTDVLAEMDIADVLAYLPESEKSLTQALDAVKLEDDATLDDVPPLPDEPESKPGEVYELGPHRLICGDSTDADTIATLMGDDRAACVWTDPPYGVAYVGKTKDALKIENDNLKPEVLEQLLRDSLGMTLTYTENGGAWYVASPGGDLFHIFGTVLRELGVWRHTLIWVKDVMVMGRADYHYQHEPIFYGWKEGASHNWYSDRKQTTILNFDRPKRSEQHPTMKPLELIEYCLRNSTKREDIVLDPFGGSGSTLIAADRLGRRARLVELDPRYCDVIRKRYEGQSL